MGAKKKPSKLRRVITTLGLISLIVGGAYAWHTYQRVRGYQSYLTAKSTALAEASEAGDLEALERIADELVTETREFSDSLPTTKAKIFDVSAYAISEWYRRVGPMNAHIDKMNAAGAFDGEPTIGRAAIESKIAMWEEFLALNRDATEYIDTIEAELKSQLDAASVDADAQAQLLDGFTRAVQLGANRKMRESDERLAANGLAIQRFCLQYGHLIRDGGDGGSWVLPAGFPQDQIQQYNAAVAAFQRELDLQERLSEEMRADTATHLDALQQQLR